LLKAKLLSPSLVERHHVDHLLPGGCFDRLFSPLNLLAQLTKHWKQACGYGAKHNRCEALTYFSSHFGLVLAGSYFMPEEYPLRPSLPLD
jgi:hypothetical protein